MSAPKWHTKNHEIPDPEKGFRLFVFSGATCYEKDQLGIFKIANNNSVLPIAPSDPILLSNINGYSFAWNKGFNGVQKAKVRFFWSVSSLF